MATEVKQAQISPDAGRLASLDALRGFDMLMIMGVDELATAIDRASDAPWSKVLVDQFTHKAWEGFAFYDLIFPLFIFLVGASLVFSLDKALARGGVASAIVRLSRRAVLLFLLGVFYNGGIAEGFENIRWMGVLQRIALSYFFAAIIYLACRRSGKRVAVVAALILLIYGAVLTFIPAPGRSTPSFEREQNLANYLDQRFLPGRLYEGTWDPEGILSSLPAVANCLIGVLAGLLLKNPAATPQRKALWLAVAGAALTALGYLWGLQTPVIKRIWTSSYALVAGGYSLLLLSAFYQVVDVWGWRRSVTPFVWVGSNALTLYLVSGIVDLKAVAERLVGGETKAAVEPWGDVLVIAVALGLIVWLAAFMYRRRVFIRV
jgi:predicted acyltransferase